MDILAEIRREINEIEEYEQNGDIENYTILVHALKSTSRLLGAIELSEKARMLEEAGDDNKIDEIKKGTPELLMLYRNYKDNLNGFNVGIGLGAGYYFTPNIGLTARYVAGLTDFNKDNNVKERNNVFQVGLAYKFGK